MTSNLIEIDTFLDNLFLIDVDDNSKNSCLILNCKM